MEGSRKLGGVAAFLALWIAAVPLRGISVTDFGATGDGKTDATAAFREAIEKAGMLGERLEIPAGRFLISDDLHVEQAVKFEGQGSEVSVLTSNGEKARIFVEASGTEFRDLGFEAMTEPIALVSREGYVLEKLRFERCRFERIEATDSNRGTIGLSSGTSAQRGFRIRRVAIVDCVFRDIHANAVNIRADISDVTVLRSQFLGIGTKPEDDAGESVSAIRLGGYVEKTDGEHDKSPNQGRHLIARNTIRGMWKSSETGNLKGILLYGDYNLVRDNIIEEIDGGEAGQDTNAIYLRGAYNTVSGNTIRNIRGADDDGAISFKGEMARGSRFNAITGNRIENIRGMSAVEVSTSDFLLEGNWIADAPARGFYHRSGENTLVRNNRFAEADILIRTSGGEVEIVENELAGSSVILGQRRSHPSRRESVTIRENEFSGLEKGELAIRMENDVEERRVSIRENRFLGMTDFEGDWEEAVDLNSNGSVRQIDFRGNTAERNGAKDRIAGVGK